MKKPIYQSFAMSFLFAAFAFLSTGSTFAQSQIPMRAAIPFEFYVGDKLFAKGNYTVTRTHDEAFLIRRQDGGDAVIARTPAFGRVSKTIESERLVFNRYGGKYFLRQIFSNRRAEGFALLKSQVEKDAQREFKSNRTILIKRPFPEQVAVSLKIK